MVDKLKVFLLKWIYSTKTPPVHGVYYDGYYLYTDKESMHKFKLKNDLYPKAKGTPGNNGIEGNVGIPMEECMKDKCQECLEKEMGFKMPYNAFSAEEARSNTERVVEEKHKEDLRMVPVIIEECFKRIKERIMVGGFFIKMNNPTKVKDSSGDCVEGFLTKETLPVFKKAMNKLGYKVDYVGGSLSGKDYYYVEWSKELPSECK